MFGFFLKFSFLGVVHSKSLLNVSQYCFCFMFWFFGHKACGISAPRSGMEPSPPALEGEVLNIGPPRKSSVFGLGSLSHTNTHTRYASQSPALYSTAFEFMALTMPALIRSLLSSLLPPGAVSPEYHSREGEMERPGRNSREGGCVLRGAGSKRTENSWLAFLSSAKAVLSPIYVVRLESLGSGSNMSSAAH